ncbi:MAG: MoaD/ThiS family protein [Bacillota bacterium]
MLVKFYPPSFFNISSVAIDFTGALTVEEMLKCLAAEDKKFGTILPLDFNEEEIRNRFLVFVNGRVAGLKDMVSDHDMVEIVPPVSGG